MTMTGYDLEDIGHSLSWGALGAFLHKLDISSETAKELDPDLAVWCSLAKTNALLADLYDLMAQINANLCAIGSGDRASRPKKYPRPGNRNKDAKHIGNAAKSPEELRKFFTKRGLLNRKQEVNSND